MQNFRLSAQLSVPPPSSLFPVRPSASTLGFVLVVILSTSQRERAYASCATYLRTKVKKPKAIKFSIVSLALYAIRFLLIHSLAGHMGKTIADAV